VGGYLRRLARLWWLVALAGIVAAGAAAGVQARQAAVYQATATITLRAAPGLPLGRDLTRLISNLDTAYLPQLLIAILSDDQTYAQAVRAAGVADHAEAYDLTATLGPGRAVLVQASGPDPRVCAALANAATEAARRQVEGLYRLVTVTTLEAAAPPSAPIRPAPMQTVPLAAGLGLLLGALLAVLLDYLAAA
jgi:uncharacterized protein involved in exopolysaccharide biosynthesis